MGKVRDHFKQNWKLYAGIGAGVAVASVTCLIMKNNDLLCGSCSPLRCGSEELGRAVVDNTTRSSIFGWGNTSSTVNNAVTTIHQGTRGPSGFVTRCIDTGELFQSQRLAASTFGISESALSSHLNKGVPLDQGLSFERLGVFS